MTETSGHKDKKNITRLKAENHRLRDELAAARKEIDFRGALVQEAYHRTKNHLSVLLSTLNLQVRSHSGTEVEGALLDARSRVMAVLSLNDRFSRANDKSSMDAGPYIKGLVRAVFDMLAEKKSDIELELEVDNVSLDSEKLLSCGLLLNELLMNSLRHAFRKKDKGKINVYFRRQTDDHICMGVRDNGRGFNATQDMESSDASLGLRIIKTLSHQLQGATEFHCDKGTDCRVVFKR